MINQILLVRKDNVDIKIRWENIKMEKQGCHINWIPYLNNKKVFDINIKESGIFKIVNSRKNSYNSLAPYMRLKDFLLKFR